MPPHKRGIGFVFQDLALWPHLTVQKNLEFVLESVKTASTESSGTSCGRSCGSFGSNTCRADILTNSPVVSSNALRLRAPLSGGHAAPARRAVLEPRPGISGDPSQRALHLHRALHVTTVYVTHNREDAAVLADYVIEMRAGRIASISGAQKE